MKLDRKIIDEMLVKYEVADVTQMSIRQLGRMVAELEESTEMEFIHMELGAPGIPALSVAVEAEKRALDLGLCGQYPNIEGVPMLKSEMATFARRFMNLTVGPADCIPTVGAMQGGFAALLAAARLNPARPVTLFIDPGFPVNKTQLNLLGLPYRSFDIHYSRGDKLRSTLESHLMQGDVCTITYSSPNNPSWISLTEEELEIIGELATQYDVIVVEDLAYFGMDFRKNYGLGGPAVYHPTVARYTDNYILLFSASKVFSYAGQRIGVMILPENLRMRRYPHLSKYYSSDLFGQFVVYGVLYSTTAGASHTAQYAMANVLQAINNAELNFTDALRIYETKARVMKKLFFENGFYLVYTEQDGSLADGFYFTFAYPGFTADELMKELLCHGISAIALAITGSEDRHGLRACVSFVGNEQVSLLGQRLQEFSALHSR